MTGRHSGLSADGGAARRLARSAAAAARRGAGGRQAAGGLRARRQGPRGPARPWTHLTPSTTRRPLSATASRGRPTRRASRTPAWSGATGPSARRRRTSSRGGTATSAASSRGRAACGRVASGAAGRSRGGRGRGRHRRRRRLRRRGLGGCPGVVTGAQGCTGRVWSRLQALPSDPSGRRERRQPGRGREASPGRARRRARSRWTPASSGVNRCEPALLLGRRAPPTPSADDDRRVRRRARRLELESAGWRARPTFRRPRRDLQSPSGAPRRYP